MFSAHFRLEIFLKKCAEMSLYLKEIYICSSKKECCCKLYLQAMFESFLTTILIK